MPSRIKINLVCSWKMAYIILVVCFSDHGIIAGKDDFKVRSQIW